MHQSEGSNRRRRFDKFAGSEFERRSEAKTAPQGQRAQLRS